MYAHLQHRNLFLTRVAAILLTIPLLFRIVWPVAVAESTGLMESASPSLHIYVGDTEIYDGMEIDPTGYIHAQYKFKSTRSELANAEGDVILPERLNAAYPTFDQINGTDSKGKSFIVGELTIDEELNVKVSFLDLLDGTVHEDDANDGVLIFANPEPEAGEDETVELATSGDTDSGNNGNTNNVLAASGDDDFGNEEDADSGSAASGDNDSGNEEDADSGSDADGDDDSGDEEDADSGSDASGDADSGDEQLNYIFQPKLSLLSMDNNADIEVASQGNPDGNNNNDNDDNDDGDTEIDPDELITVKFDVPVKIDTTGLTANEDGSYDVELESGGETVTVKVVPAAPVDFAPAAYQYATTGELKDAVNITGSELIIGGQTMEAGYTYDVKTGDTVRITYYFNMSGAQAQAIDKTAGNSYSVVLPSQLPAGTSVNLPLKTRVETGGVEVSGSPFQYGVLTAATGKDKACIEFGGDFWSSTYEHLGLQDAFFTIEYSLSSAGFSGTGPFSIVLSDGSTINLYVDRPEEVPPSVTKTHTGSYDHSTGCITWKVTYKPGNLIQAQYTINFEDTFDTSVQTYVEDSFMVNGVQAAPSATSPIKYTHTVTRNDADVVFTYKTKLTPEAFKDYEPTVATNGVTIVHNTPSGTLLKTATAGVTVPAKDKKMVAKKQVPTTEDREIDWEITVYTQGLDIDTDTLIITDILPEGLKLVYSDDTSVVVKDAANRTLGDSEYSVTTGTKGNAITSDTGEREFYVKILSDNYSTKYTITFKTTVADHYYDKVETATFVNNAEIDFTVNHTEPHEDYLKTDYTTGAGPGPGVGTANTDIIKKSASTPTYHSVNRVYYIDWTITVNPHKTNVTGATITDKIPEGLELVDGSISHSTLTDTNISGFTFTTSATTDTLTFGITNLKKNTLTIKYKTRVTEKTLYENKSLSFTNEAKFDGTVDVEGVPGNVEQTAKDTAKMISSVLKKENLSGSGSGSYNYDTQTINWKIIVNENKVKMTTAEMTDVLPAGLKYDKASLTVTDGTPLSSSDYTAVFDTNIEKLTIIFPNYFASGGKTVTVTYSTTVDVSEISNVKDASDNSGSAKIANIASLKWQENTVLGNGNPSASASQDIPVKMVSKTSDPYDPNNKVIHYKISVNPHDVNLKNAKLVDEIDKALKLDLGSMKLYYATVTSSGALTKGGAVDTSLWDWVYNDARNADNSGNTFTVELPQSSQVSRAECYILEYDCYLVSAATSVTNKVTFSADGYHERTANAPVVWVYANAGAITSFINDSIRLNISKVDSRDDGTPLPGIEFELWTMVGNDYKQVGGGTTEADGKLTFSVLSPNKEYWLVEKDSGTISSYYETNNGVVTASGVTSDKKVTGDKDHTYSFTTGNSANPLTSISVTNEHKTAPNGITFYKKCAVMGAFLPGAQFRLVTAGAPLQQNPYIKATYAYMALSDGDGKVSFPDIPVGTTYILKEIKAPYGHAITDPNKEYIVEMDTNGDYTISDVGGVTPLYSSTSGGSWTILNDHPSEPPQPVTMDIEFTKVDKGNTGITLNYATFKLTEIDDTSTYTAEATSINNGNVIFKDVPAGIYTLEETDAPPYYEADYKRYTLIINSSGVYRILDSVGRELYLSNDQAAYPGLWMAKNVHNPTQKDANTMVDIKFSKIRSGNTPTPLNGAKFVLTGDIDGTPRTFDPAYSRNGGIVAFSNVPVGVYTLVETAPPPGYLQDSTVYTVVVNHDGTYSGGGSFKIFDASGQVIYDSGKDTELWKVKNTFAPKSSSSSRSSRSRTGIVTPIATVDPLIPVIPGTTVASSTPATPTPPAPRTPGHRLITEDDGKTYIELDDEGTPLGRWSQVINEEGDLVWIFDEFPPLGFLDFGDPSSTGDSSKMSLWRLIFCGSTLALIAMVWPRKKEEQS